MAGSHRRTKLAFDPTQLAGDKQEWIIREFGDPGRAWIARYPALIDQCVARWELTLLGVAPAGWPSNITYFAEGAGGEALVLKLGYPHPEQITEMIALREYAGRGVPHLVDCSEALGATLMERIVPGSTFRSWGNSIERSRLPMEILGRLPFRRDRVAGLPTFDDWLERAFAEFREKLGEQHVFYRHIAAAESTYREFRGRHPDNWLLHGDLHHENILLDGPRGWLAIDPKGVIGPKPMECGRFLHNFLEDEIEGVERFADASVGQLCEVLDIRFETFSKTLGMTRKELAEANYIDAVLSFCWTVNSDPAYTDFQPVDASLQMLEHEQRGQDRPPALL